MLPSLQKVIYLVVTLVLAEQWVDYPPTTLFIKSNKIVFYYTSWRKTKRNTTKWFSHNCSNFLCQNPHMHQEVSLVTTSSINSYVFFFNFSSKTILDNEIGESPLRNLHPSPQTASFPTFLPSSWFFSKLTLSEITRYSHFPVTF